VSANGRARDNMGGSLRDRLIRTRGSGGQIRDTHGVSDIAEVTPWMTACE
jgi:hypothetical protein